MSPFQLLLRFMKRYPWRVGAGLAMAVAGTLLGYVFPGLTQWFLDDIIPNRQTDKIVLVSVIGLAAFLLRQCFYSIRTLANNAFELRMTYDLRSELHRKIQHLPLKWFDRQSTGDILTRMADDVPAMQRVIIDGVDQGAPAILQILLTAAVMFWMHPKLAAIIMLPVPLIIMGGWVYAHWVSPRAVQAREAASGLNTLLHDNVAGIRQIKSYTLEQEKQADFDVSSSKYREQQTRLQRAWAIYGPGMGFLGDTGLILLMGFGSYWCIREELSIGQLAQFLLFIGMLYEPIGRLHGVNQTLQNGLASAKRIFEVLLESGAEDLEQGEKLQLAKGEIEFRNVNFCYDGTRPILKNINLLVKPQQTVAIVGATGAGKSTLFQLLTRFYEPDHGEILLDGQPITVYSKSSLRDQLGYVTQESYLFNQSIRENLKLGKPDATDEEMWEALRQACADEFVRRMEDGLDAMVGERGTRLSGGEKQRISLARAFLKNAPILLLDEATSAVDSRSERQIQRAIDELRTNRTCLVIAHRLSTIVKADHIYVMRQGEVVAHGTHEQLLAEGGYYAELARLSFQEERLDDRERENQQAATAPNTAGKSTSGVSS